MAMNAKSARPASEAISSFGGKGSFASGVACACGRASSGWLATGWSTVGPEVLASGKLGKLC